MAGRAVGGAASRAWRTGGRVELFVRAGPEQVYAAVADVTRIGERSPECWTAAWLDGHEPGAVGSRFRGRNRVGLLARWSRTCEVVEAVPGVAFGFRTVPAIDPSRRDSTAWRYELAPEAGGTTVVHSYELLRPPLPPFKLLYGVLLPQHRDMRPQMAQNLEALRRQLEPPAAPR